MNIHEAKTHLSRLVGSAANGEVVIIAKAGRPMVRVIPVDEPDEAAVLLGVLSGFIEYPEDMGDFNAVAADEVKKMFGAPGENPSGHSYCALGPIGRQAT